jgi:formylglycine-generating enzyme required for sulfatase activity
MRRALVVPLLAVTLLCVTSALAEKPSRDLIPMPKVPAGSVPIAGQYWALIIGIDKYKEAPQLETAVKDAKGVRDVLASRYGFRSDKIIELVNEKATRTNIESALLRLGRESKPEDSVFIYYAGHGKYDDDRNLGWWVPVEGEPQEPATFISNASIRDYVGNMRARHVYLVADSCFSGTLFAKSRAMLPAPDDKFYARLYAKQSRWALTSGGTEPVEDRGRQGHSIFAYYFIQALRENEEPYLIPLTIAGQVAPLVARNSSQVPRSEPMQGANDDGGQFVFRLSAGAAAKQSPAASAESARNAELEAERQRLQAERDAFEREKREADERAKLEAERKQLEEERRRLAEAERLVAQKKELAAAVKEAEERLAEAERKKQEVIQEARVRPPSAPGQMGREITSRDGAPMLLVPAGEFLYGDNNQRMSLSAFYMDKYEVTTKLYAQFLQATSRKQPEYWNQVSQVSAGDRPVIGVDWYDADAYCHQYGKRLPTEQEWEKAARGTDGRKYPWGNDEPSSGLANFGKQWQANINYYSERLTAVGSYESGKSPYGIYDLAGNVWEWTSSDEGSNKVIRGGSWYNYAADLRSSIRTRFTLRYVHVVGFRCAQDAR